MVAKRDGYNLDSFYINGVWKKASSSANKMSIINPASINDIGSVALGSVADVDDAVLAARVAFQEFQGSTKNERLGYLENILAVYKSRYEEFVEAICLEMGSPVTLSREAQAYTAIEHLESTIAALEKFELREEYDV